MRDTKHEATCENCKRATFGIQWHGDTPYCPTCGLRAKAIRPLSGPTAKWFPPCAGCERCGMEALRASDVAVYFGA